MSETRAVGTFCRSMSAMAPAVAHCASSICARHVLQWLTTLEPRRPRSLCCTKRCRGFWCRRQDLAIQRLGLSWQILESIKPLPFPYFRINHSISSFTFCGRLSITSCNRSRKLLTSSLVCLLSASRVASRSLTFPSSMMCFHRAPPMAAATIEKRATTRQKVSSDTSAVFVNVAGLVVVDFVLARHLRQLVDFVLELVELGLAFRPVGVALVGPALQSNGEVQARVVVDRDGDFWRRVWLADRSAMGRYVSNGRLLVLGSCV